MKTIFLILGLAFLNCTCEEDAVLKQPEVFTSLHGEWTFQTSTFPCSGEFKIATLSGVLVVEEGEYTVNGNDYNVTQVRAMELGLAPGTFSRFWLISDDDQFVFDNATWNSEFTEITCQKYNYMINGAVIGEYTEEVVITRK